VDYCTTWASVMFGLIQLDFLGESTIITFNSKPRKRCFSKINVITEISTSNMSKDNHTSRSRRWYHSWCTPKGFMKSTLPFRRIYSVHHTAASCAPVGRSRNNLEASFMFSLYLPQYNKILNDAGQRTSTWNYLSLRKLKKNTYVGSLRMAEIAFVSSSALNPYKSSLIPLRRRWIRFAL